MDSLLPPPQNPYVLIKPTVDLEKSVIKSTTKNFARFASKIKACFSFWAKTTGLFVFLLANTAGAVEEIVVYGKRVPTGFYDMTSNSLSNLEMEALYMSAGSRGGMSELDFLKMEWAGQCGYKLHLLREAEKTCMKNTFDHYDVMIDFCDDISTGRLEPSLFIGTPFFGGSVTWTSTSHDYQHCANKADNARGKSQLQCESDFEDAKAKNSTCKGASGW